MLRQVCLRALQQPVRGQALRSGWPALLATSTSRSASSRSGKDTDEFGDNEVHVPADLSSIAHLNPELHSVLVGSAIHASYGAIAWEGLDLIAVFLHCGLEHLYAYEISDP